LAPGCRALLHLRVSLATPVGRPEAAGVDAGGCNQERVAHLSVEDTALLKRETKNVIEECVKDPGPSDPGTATGLFARLRVRRISLGPASSPAWWSRDLDRACVEPLATVHFGSLTKNQIPAFCWKQRVCKFSHFSNARLPRTSICLWGATTQQR